MKVTLRAEKRTPQPKITNAQMLERYQQVFTPAYDHSTSIAAARALGNRVWDVEGKEYLDLASGIAVNNLGHNYPRVVAAIQEQLASGIHFGPSVMLYEANIRLAEKLGEITPLGIDMFFFSNSGAEAVEGAVKLARYVTGRPLVIAYRGGFHGRTLGALSLTSSKAKFRRHLEPLLGGVRFVNYPYYYRSPCGQKDPESCALGCLADLARAFEHDTPPDEVAAVLIEPVLGEGGYVVPPKRYLEGLRELTAQHGILLIFDEVQTGFGRTGDYFAAQRFGVTPDIMVLAKGIANGLPLSAVASSKDLMSRWPAGAHGTTFGGNPLSCAAGIATISVLQEENLCRRAGDLGEYFLGGLKELQKKHPAMGDVRGLGLMIGAEFVDRQGQPNGELVKQIRQYCLERGLILLACGSHYEVIRFIAPLTIAQEDLDFVLGLLDEALTALA